MDEGAFGFRQVVGDEACASGFDQLEVAAEGHTGFGDGAGGQAGAVGDRHHAPFRAAVHQSFGGSVVGRSDKDASRMDAEECGDGSFRGPAAQEPVGSTLGDVEGFQDGSFLRVEPRHALWEVVLGHDQDAHSDPRGAGSHRASSRATPRSMASMRYGRMRSASRMRWTEPIFRARWMSWTASNSFATSPSFSERTAARSFSSWARRRI